MTTSEAIEIGMVLTDTQRTWAIDCIVTSLTGPTGSDKSITVREVSGNRMDRDLVLNRRSLKRYAIV